MLVRLSHPLPATAIGISELCCSTLKFNIQLDKTFEGARTRCSLKARADTQQAVSSEEGISRADILSPRPSFFIWINRFAYSA